MGDRDVYFTYRRTDNNRVVEYIEVTKVPFSGIVSPQATPITFVYTTPFALSFIKKANPRIACPPLDRNNPMDEFIVVAEERDILANSFKIFGINQYQSGPVNLIQYYNDGSLSTPNHDISLAENNNSAVTYDANGDIWIGWVFLNVASATTGTVVYPMLIDSDYPISL
jgi:hypothetical protein